MESPSASGRCTAHPWPGCAAALILIGCVGEIHGGPFEDDGVADKNPSSSGTLGGDPRLPVTSFNCPSGGPDPGPAPLKRLTTTQYANSVKLVFGSGLDLSDVFPNVETRAHIGLVQPDVSQLDVETYHRAAVRTAEFVAKAAPSLAPCAQSDALATARVCAENFVARVGPLLYRTPLVDGDLSRLLTVFEVGYELGSYEQGLELVTQAMLDSPRFLYRPEFGNPEDSPAKVAEAPSIETVALSAYELATRLSFAFWNSGPDQALLDSAKSGALNSLEGLKAEAERLSHDERADESFRQFLYAWLRLGDLDYVTKEPELFPTWQTSTPSEMRKQSDAFFDHVLFGEDATLKALFTTPLAEFAPPTLADWHSADAEPRLGVLTLPALLAVHSKPNDSFPIYRGLLVREQILCQPLPSPPANVGEPPEPAPNVSTRERFQQHSTEPVCNSCHEIIDDLGFAFEHYDAIGRYRREDGGKPIDASGELTFSDSDGTFDGLRELSEKLMESAQVRACVSRQWFRYVMQRFEQPADGCSMAPLLEAFTESGGEFASLRTAIVDAPAFRMRRTIATEENQP